MAVWKPGELLNLSGSIGQVASAIRGAVAAGLGANETVAWLRSIGMGRRRENVLSMHAAYTYAYKDPSVYLPRYAIQKPRAELIPLSIYQQSRSYLTTAWFDTYNPEWGVYERKYFSLSHSELETMDDLIDRTLQNAYWNDSDVGDVLDYGISSILYSDNPLLR